MTRLAIVAIAAACISVAHAAPPAPGSEQYEMLHPYAGWIGQVHTATGLLCCSLADGAAVSARQKDGRWQVMFDPADTRIKAPAGWVDVPDDAIVRAENPTAMPLAWWYGEVVRCFIAPGGV